MSLATRCQLPGGEGKLEGASGSKLEGDYGRQLVGIKPEGDSGSKLEGALVLDTRCHCMNTSSENMTSFCVWPLDVTHGGKLEGDSGSKLEGDSGSGSKL